MARRVRRFPRLPTLATRIQLGKETQLTVEISNRTYSIPVMREKFLLKG